MKTLFFATLLLISATSQAVDKTLLSEMEELYLDMDYHGNLVDHNYFIHFTADTKALDAMVADAVECQVAGNFKSTTSTEVIELIRDEVREAIDILEDGTDGWFSQMDRLYTTTDEFFLALEGKTLEMCIYSSTPAYSDGHETKFIKVDGITTFAFEVGHPD